jgi:hypothetical protein
MINKNEKEEKSRTLRETASTGRKSNERESRDNKTDMKPGIEGKEFRVLGLRTRVLVSASGNSRERGSLSVLPAIETQRERM